MFVDMAHLRLLDGLNQLGECLGVSDRNIRQSFAVYIDAFAAQCVDESGVTHPVLPAGGVDADNPQPAEIAFTVFPIAISVKQSFFNCLFGRFEEFPPSAAIAFGHL